MKKILLFSVMVCGFALITSAQTSTPSTVVGTEIKKDAASTTNQDKVDQKASAETPKEEVVVKKECSKKEGKSCCKAGTATTGGATKGECAKKCEGEKKEGCSKGSKDCCKKKATEKTGS